MSRASKINTINDLFKKSNWKLETVNFITLYRIITAPLLLILIIRGFTDLFKWLLLLSFISDILDGYLARRLKVSSELGAKLDSIGDDLTILVAIIGLFFFKIEFIKEQLFFVIILLSLYLMQLLLSLIKYQKISSFHTYGAKICALLQGVFLLSVFFFKEPIYPLFYLSSILTIAELIEEIILVFILPNWESNVKGLYWVLKKVSKNR